jgi:hypothetical protein
VLHADRCAARLGASKRLAVKSVARITRAPSGQTQLGILAPRYQTDHFRSLAADHGLGILDVAVFVHVVAAETGKTASIPQRSGT